jgi:hypothetical protein
MTIQVRKLKVGRSTRYFLLYLLKLLNVIAKWGKKNAIIENIAKATTMKTNLV